MGTSLTGLTPSTTYDALIKVGDNGSLSATSKYIGDGLGNDSVLSLSTTKVGIGTSAPTSLLTLSGTSEATPSSTTGGIFNVIGSSTNALIIGSLSGSPFGMYIQGGGSGIYPLVLNPQGGDVSIGTTSPTARLQVKGSGSTFATNSLLVQNGSGSNMFRVRDDGSVYCEGGGALSSTGIIGTLYGLFGGASYEASASLVCGGTTTGFLPPRMTTTQRNAIASPAEGLVIYNTTTQKLNLYTTAWEAITSL